MSVFDQKELVLPKPNYQYITDEDAARKALNILSAYPDVALDTEATALDPYEAQLTLVQMGVPGHTFVFDVRHDTEHSSLHPEVLSHYLQDKSRLKILQNAVYDMKIIKRSMGFYLENIFDTMLAEQLLHLGMPGVKASLEALVFKYLGLNLDKEPRGTFEKYDQKFEPYQLEYAANDVVALHTIRDIQYDKIVQESLENAARLEFEFTVPMSEMELNGITLDEDKWSTIMSDVQIELEEAKEAIEAILNKQEDQTTLFGVSVINIDSNKQLLKALRKYGLNLENTAVDSLRKNAGIPVIDAILDYRKAQKLISSYSSSLIEKINKYTGRLHTDFKQMVATGRMSSSNPNLQQIPKKQKFRSCFIAKPGYALLTSDMSGAELRILGNLSQDPIFIESYANGIDLHTRTAAEVFGVAMDKVTHKMRGAAKAINFGLCYGMSVIGLSKRLGIGEKDSKEMIGKYFDRYRGVKKYLDKSGRDSVRNRYSTTVSGRKRYYNMPPYDHPDHNKIKGAIERKGKNAGIQGANADTIKEAMILLVDRLKPYDAKLILTVHDEVVVEAKEEQKYEVAKVVSQTLCDGFGKYFSLIPMTADTLIGPCWLKDACEEKPDGKNECGHTEMKFVPDKKYGNKLVCGKCGGGQD